MLIFALFSLLQGISNINLMNIGGIVGVLYCTWAIGQFFGKGKIINYAKAFFAYILGLLTFCLLAIFLGVLIDMMIKH